jgi:hypothetical protein
MNKNHLFEFYYSCLRMHQSLESLIAVAEMLKKSAETTMLEQEGSTTQTFL